ncbi:MAG: flagellar assembly protein FliW [Lachnospiraceae bacterium]|nr:flagellar assembly protein FliW [Lachnospiraceae bacterium]
MVIKTKIFGDVTVDAAKLILFPQGIVGFPDLKEFMLIHDSEAENSGGIQWLQSIEEPGFAMPVMDPLLVRPDYNPTIEDEFLKPLGEFTDDNMLVLTTVSVPHEIEQMSVNLMAPFIINMDTRKAIQIIVDDTYEVKFKIYDILKEAKEKAEKAGK